MIDTHCHLYSQEFEADILDVLQRAEKEGVTSFYLPAIDSSTHTAMINLGEKYKGLCFSMMGVHPCSIKENYLKELQIAENWLQKRKFAAIGETGLDFYWDKTFMKEQVIALEKHIEWALQYKLPLVLHTRNAMHETIHIIKKYSSTALTGIFHCFGGSIHEANEIIETGFLLGIGGTVTYKNSGVAEVLKEVSLNSIVLETDAPYLSPVPFRGKRNESSYLAYIAKKMAEIKNISVQEVQDITTKNAEMVFSLQS